VSGRRTTNKFVGIRSELIKAIRAHREAGVRFIVQGALAEEDCAAFRDVGAITSDDPCESGELLSRVRMLSALRSRARRISPLVTSSHPSSEEVSLDESSAIRILASCGIPFPGWIDVTFEPGGPLPAHQLEYPIAVKKVVPGVTHKSELGYVRLNVGDDASLLEALNALSSLPTEHFVLMEMAGEASLELLVGTTVDPMFGRLFMLALGGKLAEFLARSVVLMSPVTEDSVRSALRDLGLTAFVEGHRGDAPMDVGGVLGVFNSLERLLLERPATTDAEVNPLIVLAEDGSVVAVDAVIRER